MRNVFDQYRHPENQVTHALVTALHEDRKLLRSFLTDIARQSPSKADGPIEICEQTYPGVPPDEEAAEDEVDRQGIPDAWITAGDKWCLVIENKVLSSVTLNQMSRHLGTAKRLGYANPKALILTIRKPTEKLPDDFRVVEWRSVYRWLIDQSGESSWAGRAAEFLEHLEARMVDREQMTSGTLTAFNGFQFGPDNPFTYLEGKRVLGLAMDELRQRKDLRSELGVDPDLPGRPAIKGKGTDSVWNVLQFSEAPQHGNFTKSPHLTLGIDRLKVDAMVTVPDKAAPTFQRRLVGVGLSEFHDLIGTIQRRMKPLLHGCPGSEPRLRVHQRHWKSRSGPASSDAMIDVDLRTAGDGKGPTKRQPQWVDAIHTGLVNRNSNLELQIGVVFPYRTCPKIQTAKALDYVARAWIACGPLLDTLSND